MTQRRTSLPKLPLPNLQSTCQKFLEWVKPLLPDNDWNATCHIVEEFAQEGGNGEKLQQVLEAWAKKHVNWLEPLWDDAYLCGRESLVLNTNPFFCPGKDVQQTPRTQTDRAVDIILGMIELKQQLDSGTFLPDTVKGNLLCMYQYQRLFSTTRIPSQQRDMLRSPDSMDNPSPTGARHIIVIYKGEIYCLDVINDEIGQNGKYRPPEQIKADLESILNSPINDADRVFVGMLTSLDREEWAKTRELLVAESRNAANLNCIETALFAICLETDNPTTRNDFYMSLLAGEEGNRWYDKSLQFIVFPDGQYGINMEHSGLDASPIVRIPPPQSQDVCESGKYTVGYKRLEFTLTNNVLKTIKKARRDYRKQIDNTTLEYKCFDAFGRDFIKVSKTSPDAFMQLGIQLAQYRLFGHCRSTYEAVMTRSFLHGRTEAMRPVTPQSLSFVRCMDNPNFSVLEKQTFFRNAVEAHVARLAECKTGNGVQRHLYALECMYKLQGQELDIPVAPAIFSSKAWHLLCHDFLSTSTAGSADGIVLAGFAPVVDEGFGICYLVSEENISLCVCCRHNMKPKLTDFASAIESALLDLGILLHGH